jgi:hypothetical protein
MNSMVRTPGIKLTRAVLYSYCGLAIAITILIAMAYGLHWITPSLPSSRTELLEEIFFTAQTILVLVAILAFAYARDQVEEARQMRSAQLRQATATFILELDRKWDSEEIRKALRIFARMRRDCLRDARIQYQTLNDEARRPKAGELFSSKLTYFRTSDKEEELDIYRSLYTFAGFMETIGVMVKRQYVSAEDIDDLFRGPVLDFGIYFTGHILERTREEGVVEGLFENALSLVERVKQIRT